jgi:hypothetical protein
LFTVLSLVELFVSFYNTEGDRDSEEDGETLEMAREMDRGRDGDRR